LWFCAESDLLIFSEPGFIAQTAKFPPSLICILGSYWYECNNTWEDR
jgi:hypothetical protein